VSNSRSVHVDRSRNLSSQSPKSRILEASWYDYPQYYDIAFQACTADEADFIEAACRKYCPFDAHYLLEPACGSGRLVAELVSRGYQLTGFDLSRPALNYLRRRLMRRRLYANTFAAEMSNFQLRRLADAAYCLRNTFRHLGTEKAARAHLQCIANSLRAGGIYVVGLNLLQLNGDTREAEERCRRKRGNTTVAVRHRVLRTDVNCRLEHHRVVLLARSRSKELRLRHEFQLRTYTPSQFRRLLASVPALELCDVYHSCRDIDRPLKLNNEVIYGVLVLRRRNRGSHP
jgi:Methyltransferase domain